MIWLLAGKKDKNMDIGIAHVHMETPMRKLYLILQRKVFCCDTHVNISSATATMGCQFLWSAGQESTSWGNMSSLLLHSVCRLFSTVAKFDIDKHFPLDLKLSLYLFVLWISFSL